MSTTTLSSGLNRSVIEEAGAPGADLIILEMMRDVIETRLCLEAAIETGLPIWLGFSAERGPHGNLQLYGSQIPFADGLDQVLAGAGTPQAIGVMHSELELIPDALQAIRQTLSPQAFAAAAMDWVGVGARAVGGCCGIRPAHIEELSASLPQDLR